MLGVVSGRDDRRGVGGESVDPMIRRGMPSAVPSPVNDNEPDPYFRGIEDFAGGVPRHMNPFDETDYGTTLWESWFDGWDDANEGARDDGMNF
jgi:hypothetical protein